MADPVTNLPLDAIVKSTPLDGVMQSFRVDSPERIDNRGIDVSVATGLSPDEVSVKTAEGDNGPIEAAKSSVGDVVGDAVATSIASQAPVDEAARVVTETQEKKTDMEKFSDFLLESALTVDSPDYNPAMARSLANQQIAFEVLSERFKNANAQGTGATILDFIDRFLIRQIPIGALEDITGRSERKGLELAQAAASMGHDEYREYIEAYADELAEEGFFRGENWFAYQAGLNEATNSGYDPMTGLNAALGVVDLIPTAGLMMKSASLVAKSGKVLGRVGAIRGVQAADNALERLAKADALKHPEVADELHTTANSLSKDTGNVSATQSKVDAIFSENKLLQDIQALYRAGSFGRMATSQQVNEAAAQTAEAVKKISSRPTADIDVVDLTGLGDNAVRIKLGKMTDGTPYQGTASGKTSATKAAASMRLQGLAADVVPVDPNDLKKGYYVQVEERLDLTGASNAIEVGKISQRMIGQALGSTRLTDDLRLNTMANMAEGGQGAIREVVKPHLKKLEGLSYDSKMAIGQVFKDLRDGPDAFIRDGYTDAEFATKFKQYHPKGKAPTEADYEAFWAAKTVNDTAYILQANRLASRYVTKGYKSISVGETSLPARKITTKLDDDVVILDQATNRAVYSQDVTDDLAIWQLDRELDGGIQYVMRPKTVRSIQYDDVLSYNAGGRRVNPEANYFVTSGEGRGRALLTAFSEKQALLASRQLEAIFDAARRSGRKLDELTNELDDVLARNNDWNPSVVSTADFVALARKKGWNIDDKVSYKQRNGVVEDPTSQLYNGMRMDDYVRATHARNDDVLMEFGGKEVYNENPVAAMVQQLSDTSAEYAFRNYNYNAKAAWLKSALRVDKLPDGADINQLFRETQVTGSGATDRKLRTLRNIIERRESMRSPVGQALEDTSQAMSEWVFDSFGKKVSVGGAADKALTANFYLAFLAQPAQFLLQASHTFAITAISPLHGSKAAAALPAYRLINASSDAAVKARGYEKLAKVTGTTADDWHDIEKFMRTSGREIIENDSILKGTGGGYGVGWWEGKSLVPSRTGKALHGVAKAGRKVKDYGMVFFNEGERLSRNTGMITAILEYKAKFPKANIFGDEARMWITRREQDLTFNMTTTSRAAFQSGLMKLPTQFMAYPLRVIEGVFAPANGFTKGERIRMASMLTLISGMGTVPFLKGATDQVAEGLGIDPESTAFATLKYGLIDGFLSWGLSGVTGEDVRTAFGTRIAPWSIFTDTYRRATEESFAAAIAGPTGGLAGGAFGAVMHGLVEVTDSVFNGGGFSPETFLQDLQIAFRSTSATDNVWKAYEIMRFGMYRSKSGTTMPMEFSDVEGIMQGLGITNFKVAEFYDRKGQVYRDAKELKEFQKQVTADFRIALAKYKTDPESGKAFMKEVSARIEYSGFTPLQKAQLRRSLKANTSNEVFELALDFIQKDNEYGAKVIESLN